MSLVQLAQTYNNLKKEKYENDSNDSDTDWIENNKGVFYTLLVFSMIIYITALVLLIKHFGSLPDWAKVIGIIGLLPIIPLGPVITIIIVLVVTSKR